MPIYQYKARDKFGKPADGKMSAESENAVALKLNGMGYIPISVAEQKEGFNLREFLGKFGRVRFSDLNMFTRQLATLQKAGLPLLVSLKSIEDQAANKELKEVIGQITKDIESGMSFSAALENYPAFFSPLYVNMVSSGEAAGMLEQVLERLADLEEHDEKIRMRIKAATRYPIIVIVAMITGFLVLTTLIIPRFAKIFDQFTTTLPFPTRVLLGINFAVTKFWWLMVMILIAFIFGFNRFIHTKAGRFWWDDLKLKVPVFGPLVQKMIMSRFARITSTLMHSGIPILKVLEWASGGTGNVIISRVIDNIKINVNEGKGMAEPMRLSGMFPSAVIQMVAAGEETGKIDELLSHVSDYYDSQVDYTINNLISLIEPILIIILGCGVLFMALGIFLPMWNLMSLFKR